MSKYITLEGITFKKVDLKRIEHYSGINMLQVVVAGKRDTIGIKCEESKITEKRASILAEIED